MWQAVTAIEGDEWLNSGNTRVGSKARGIVELGAVGVGLSAEANPLARDKPCPILKMKIGCIKMPNSNPDSHSRF